MVYNQIMVEKKQTTIRMSELTRRQVEELAKKMGTITAVIAVAADRLYQSETGNKRGKTPDKPGTYLNDYEINLYGKAMLEHDAETLVLLDKIDVLRRQVHEYQEALKEGKHG